MSKFKVTLRRNGSAVGEMHYGSEAVAVTRAAEMKDATGCDVTVAPAKANRRRRNGKKSADPYVFVEGTAPDGSYFGANYKKSQLPALYEALLAAGVQRVTLDDTTEVDLTVAPAKANRRRAATRRRNGTGLSRASMHSRARAGSPAKMSERLKALGLAFEDFGKAGSPLYSLWNSYRSAQHFAEQTSRGSSASSLAEARVAFQQFVEAERVLLDAVGATRRRNPESTTLWTVRVGSQEIGEFHAPSHLTAAIARKAARVAAEQGYTASMFRRFGSVSDGMHRHPVAQFLKNGHRCNPGCGCPKSNRRRRNGTTAGEAAASRSLAHRAAMLLTR